MPQRYLEEVHMKTVIISGCALLFLASTPSYAQESFDLVSISTSGSYGNGNSVRPSVSANGRFVAFESWASDLVPGDTNDTVDAFVRDLDLGITERVGLSNTGTEISWSAAGTGYVWADGTLGISDDGMIVSFVSWDPSVVAGDTNGVTDVFVRNRALATTTRVSIRPDGGEFAGHCSGCQISSDGTRVLFAHRPPGAQADENQWYVRDLAAGTTRLVSVDPAGNPTLHVYAPKLAAGGRWVIFNADRASTALSSGTFAHNVDTGTTLALTQHSGFRNYDLDDSEYEELIPLAVSASGRFVLCWSFQDLDALDGLDVAWELNAWVLDRSTETFRLATRQVVEPGSTLSPGFESLEGYGFVSDDGRIARLNVSGGYGLLDPVGFYDGNSPTYYELDLDTTETRVLSLNWHMRPFVGVSIWDSPFGSSHDGTTVVMAGSESEYLYPFRFWGRSYDQQIFVRRVHGSAGTTICAGDGTGASCPCGTPGIAGRGCANAFTDRGALLETRGNASLADDTLTMIAYEAPLGMSVLLQSSSSAPVGGVPFEGGVLCVGSPALRIAMDLPSWDDLGVVKLFGRGAYYGPRLHEVGGITAPGTRYYQVWTRAVGGASCVESRSSLTNGVRVEWRP